MTDISLKLTLAIINLHPDNLSQRQSVTNTQTNLTEFHTEHIVVTLKL